MRSMNLKNLAAIATGVAMVGSVIAPSVLAGVDVGSDVNEFVQLVKTNPEDTKVIVGSLADVSDAIAAAELVTAIKEETAVESTVGVDGAGGISITQASGSVTLTADHYDVEYVNIGAARQGLPGNALGNATPIAYAASRDGTTVPLTTTITPDVLKDVLYRGTIEAYVRQTTGGQTDTMLQKYEYEEQILLGRNIIVRYEESESPIGHGLYVGATGVAVAAGVPAARVANYIIYKLDFTRTGTGLPLNNTTWRKTPVITVLKKEYAMDVVTARQNGIFVLYPGEAVKMLSGETYTTDDGYIVTLEDVGLQGTTTNALYANIKVEAPDGTYQRLSVEERQGAEFFNGKVSIYVDSMTGQTYTEEGQVTGRADLRVGHGKLYFDQGRAFPLDDQWTVDTVNTRTSADAATNFLSNVTVRYGNPTKATNKERGNFLGNEYTGLKQDVILNGPKNYEGTPVFNIKLTGYGGATKTDTTDVIVTAAGGTSGALGALADQSVLQVSYFDRGGLFNQLQPAGRAEVVTAGAGGLNPGEFFGDSNGPAAGGTLTAGAGVYGANGGPGAHYTATQRWGTVQAIDGNLRLSGNVHVLYYDGTYNDNGQYYPQFRIGGLNGPVITGTRAANNTGGAGAGIGNFTYTDIIDTIFCEYQMDGTGGVWIGHSEGDSTIGGNPYRCYVQPFPVFVGADLTMDRPVTLGPVLAAAANPAAADPHPAVGASTNRRAYIDLRNTTGALIGDQGSNTTKTVFPVVMYKEPFIYAAIANGYPWISTNMSVVYDSSTAADYNAQNLTIVTYTGLVVVNRTDDRGNNPLTNGAGLVGANWILALNANNSPGAIYVNSAIYPMTEADAYQHTISGSEWSVDKTVGAGTLTFKVPEAPRNTVITVAEIISENDTGGSTKYKVGDILPDGSVVTGVEESGDVTAKTYFDVADPILDTAASGTYQIAVGGPWVSTVAQGITGNEKTTLAAGTGYLIRDGNKLLVAGQTGSDTTAAVDKLIELLEAEPEVDEGLTSAADTEA